MHITHSRTINAFALAMMLTLAACARQEIDAPRTPPKTVSQSFNSAQEAFKTILRSGDRNSRYTATLFLKGKKEQYDWTLKAYGSALYRESQEQVRNRVYESMGWFGTSGVAQLLTYYLTVEEKTETKMEIVRAMGDNGPDAATALTVIEQIANDYSRLTSDLKGHGKVIVRGPNGDYEIDPAKMVSAEALQRAANEAMSRIRGQASR
jgi:hypothetical protein